MAKFFVFLSILFSLTLFSHARNPTNLPEFSYRDTVSDDEALKEDEPKLLLPSDAVGTVEKSSIDEVPANDNSENTNTDQAVESMPVFDTIEGEEVARPDPDTISAAIFSRPLMPLDGEFRPVNRHHIHHMYVRRPFWARFPRRCHGHRKYKPYAFRREIPYGNDMLQFPAGRDGGNQRNMLRLMEVDGDMMMRGPMRHMGFHGEMRHFPNKEMPYNGNFPADHEEKRAHNEEEGKGGLSKWIKSLVNSP